MTSLDQLSIGLPDIAALYGGGGDGGSLQRIFVPAGALGAAADALALATRMTIAVGGVLRVAHVRIFDPPLRGCGRFYPETSAEATAVIEEALTAAWACGAKASGVVVDAERPLVARAIASAACDWNAGIIVLSRRSRPAISRLLLGSVTDQVVRHAGCPVLVVRPGQR